MLAVLYASGLKVSEVTQLKPGDIDSACNVFWVRRGNVRLSSMNSIGIAHADLTRHPRMFAREHPRLNPFHYPESVFREAVVMNAATHGGHIYVVRSFRRGRRPGRPRETPSST